MTEEHGPVMLTSHGRVVAVVQNLQDYESAGEERALMQAVGDFEILPVPITVQSLVGHPTPLMAITVLFQVATVSQRQPLMVMPIRTIHKIQSV